MGTRRGANFFHGTSQHCTPQHNTTRQPFFSPHATAQHATSRHRTTRQPLFATTQHLTPHLSTPQHDNLFFPPHITTHHSTPRHYTASRNTTPQPIFITARHHTTRHPTTRHPTTQHNTTTYFCHPTLRHSATPHCTSQHRTTTPFPAIRRKQQSKPQLKYENIPSNPPIRLPSHHEPYALPSRRGGNEARAGISRRLRLTSLAAQGLGDIVRQHLYSQSIFQTIP